ncbi:MAG: DUF3597 domain-containing protein [Chloroflexi bacterium]|nr:DUF3597 domain-containing protein [Chloroflexota bacterium]
MGLFGKILEKLGLKKGEETKPAAATAAATVKPAAPAAKPAAEAVKPKPVASAQPTPSTAKGSYEPVSSSGPAPISEVDVVKQLEKLSLGKGLDWKVSIVDLLKLLDIDSSREARNELATELGCPADLMKDSAKMNVWLHKEVLRQIAKNGGNIPANLLD